MKAPEFTELSRGLFKYCSDGWSAGMALPLFSDLPFKVLSKAKGSLMLL